MFRGIIFDMDGVLFDTERMSEECWMRVQRETGIDIDRPFIRQFCGRGTAECVRLLQERLGPGVDVEHYRRLRRRHTDAYIAAHGVPLKKGLFELLDFLQQARIAHTIATSTARPLTMSYLESTGVGRYFDASRIVCGDMVSRCKPDPEIYQIACAQLELPPGDCIAFEDSPAGIRSAYDAGLHPVMIPDMTPPTPELDAMLLERLEDLSQAIPLLRRLMRRPQ